VRQESTWRADQNRHHGTARHKASLFGLWAGRSLLGMEAN
jgi:hypothetical protein